MHAQFGWCRTTGLIEWNAKTFKNSDGSYTAHIGAGPVHYFENGLWKTSYNTIIQNSSGQFTNYSYANVTNKVKCFYSNDISQGSAVLFENNSLLKDMLNLKVYFEFVKLLPLINPCILCVFKNLPFFLSTIFF